MTVDPAGTGIAGTLSCPRCSSPVARDQDWCLACGAAARTRLAPPPDWRVPVAVVAIVMLLAGFTIAAAFVTLTRDDVTVVPTTQTQQPPPLEPAAQG